MKELFNDEGYVQLLDSDGKTTFFEKRPDSPLGTFYQAEDDRNVNTRILGSSDFPNTRDNANHSIQQNQVVKIIEEFKSGGAIWPSIGNTNL